MYWVFAFSAFTFGSTKCNAPQREHDHLASLFEIWIYISFIFVVDIYFVIIYSFIYMFKKRYRYVNLYAEICDIFLLMLFSLHSLWICTRTTNWKSVIWPLRLASCVMCIDECLQIKWFLISSDENIWIVLWILYWMNVFEVILNLWHKLK